MAQKDFLPIASTSSLISLHVVSCQITARPVSSRPSVTSLTLQDLQSIAVLGSRQHTGRNASKFAQLESAAIFSM